MIYWEVASACYEIAGKNQCLEGAKEGIQYILDNSECSNALDCQLTRNCAISCGVSVGNQIF